MASKVDTVDKRLLTFAQGATCWFHTHIKKMSYRKAAELIGLTYQTVKNRADDFEKDFQEHEQAIKDAKSPAQATVNAVLASADAPPVGSSLDVQTDFLEQYVSPRIIDLLWHSGTHVTLDAATKILDTLSETIARNRKTIALSKSGEEAQASVVFYVPDNPVDNFGEHVANNSDEK